MADQDKLSEVQQFARGLQRDREGLAEPVEIRESLTELDAKREPTAALELSEAELVWLLRQVDRPMAARSTGWIVRRKARQALSIERGSGGNFRGDDAA